MKQYRAGHPDSALYYGRAVLQLPGITDNPAVAGLAFGLIGSAHETMGRRDSALAAYKNSLRITRALGDKSAEAAMLALVGGLYNNLGQQDSALFYSHASLALNRDLGIGAGEAIALRQIGQAFSDLGQLDSALYYDRHALQLYRAANRVDGQVTTLLQVANAYLNAAQYDSALVYVRAMLPLARQSENPKGEAAALATFGLVYIHLGQLDSAVFYLRASLPKLQSVGDVQMLATTLNNLGGIFSPNRASSWRNVDSALFYYRSALPLQRAVGNRQGEGATLDNIGAAYQAIGLIDSATAYYVASLRVHRATGDRAGEGTTLHNIAVLYSLVGARDSAAALLPEVLALRRAVGDRVGESLTLRQIALLLALKGTTESLSRAVMYYDSATAIYASVRRQTGSDASAIAFAEQEHTIFSEWAATWLRLAEGQSGQSRQRTFFAALAAAERGRAQGLRDLLTGTSARRPRPEPLTSSTRVAIDESRDSVPGSDLVAEATRSIAPVKNQRTAVLYYLTTYDNLSIWLIKPTGDVEVQPILTVPPDSLAAYVALLRQGLGAEHARAGMAVGSRGPAEQEGTAGRARGVGDDDIVDPAGAIRASAILSKILLPPALLKDVASGSELVLVPQGVLGLVPFAALTVPGDSIPLGERYALRYTPSLRALGAAERQAVSGGSTLIVGNPAMPSVAGANGERARLRDLPAAREEVARIAARVGGIPLTGEMASETTVRQQLPQARLVHFATHGLAFGTESRVRDSYVAFAPDAHNDGLFTIGELIDQVPPLASDLVVLSACQTGLGDLKQAEGTVGFQRAFLAKGARSILVSLWSVDDKATAILMDRFYTHWLGPDKKPVMSKAEALRQAQSDVRSTKGYESPKYWAAFQLVGAR
jgi:tetratricopeptide (TPR) repeat protein